MYRKKKVILGLEILDLLFLYHFLAVMNGRQ